MNPSWQQRMDLLATAVLIGSITLAVRALRSRRRRVPDNGR